MKEEHRSEEAGDMVRLNADVPDDLRKRLLHALVDEGLSFRRWLIRAIERYLEERESKGKPPRKKPGGRKTR